MRISKPGSDPHTFMFAPQPIARSKVVYPCKILHLVSGCLILRNPQLMFELATGGDFHAELPLFNLLLLEIVQRVRAACVGPHVPKGNLLSCPLLKKELAARRVEHEGGERSMEKTFIDILHQMAWHISRFCKDTQSAHKVLDAMTYKFSCQVHQVDCRSHQQ